jgi:hypothetical protein
LVITPGSNINNSSGALPAFIFRHTAKKLVLLSSTIVIIILVAFLLIYSVTQNNQYNSEYKLANADITKGQYATALTLLNKASKLFISPSDHQKISQLINQDNNWITDANELQQAQGLVKKQDFKDAVTILGKISKSFPGISEVTSEQKTIASDQATIAAAQQAAAAQAAAQAAVQAAAKAAAEKAAQQAAAEEAAKLAAEKAAQQVASNQSGPSGTNPSSAPSFSSSPPTPVGSTIYSWAGEDFSTNSTSISVDITQEQPTINSFISHSVMQIYLVGTGNWHDLEFGWIVSDQINGDYLPHLFSYVDGIQASQGCGYYNGCGFVQVSSTVKMGEAVSVGQTGNYKLSYSNGNWDFYYNGVLVGYVPDSAFAGGLGPVTGVDIYGEVESDQPTECLQMGNGLSATSAGAASFSNIQFGGAANLFWYYQTPPFLIGNAPSSNGFTVGGSSGC